jgi:hypothetical protein
MVGSDATRSSGLALKRSALDSERGPSLIQQ